MTTNNSLYEIVYTSFSRINSIEIESMIQESVKRNTENNITGCILYNDSEFYQVLEGQKEAVKLLFEKIKKDNRHSGLRVMWESDIPKRAFSNWSMLKKKVDKLPPELTGETTTGKELIEVINNLLS